MTDTLLFAMAEESPDTSSVHTCVCETSSKLLSSFSSTVKVRKSVSADKLSVHAVQSEKLMGLLQFRAPHDCFLNFLLNIQKFSGNTEDT